MNGVILYRCGIERDRGNPILAPNVLNHTTGKRVAGELHGQVRILVRQGNQGVGVCSRRVEAAAIRFGAGPAPQPLGTLTRPRTGRSRPPWPRLSLLRARIPALLPTFAALRRRSEPAQAPLGSRTLPLTAREGSGDPRSLVQVRQILGRPDQYFIPTCFCARSRGFPSLPLESD